MPAVFLLLLRVQAVSINRLDALAQARDVAALSRYLEDPNATTVDGVSPLRILKTGGGYGAGTRGWHARLLEPKDETARYVVFTTPILEEDSGELLFRIGGDGKLTYVPERFDFGRQMRHHRFDVSFDLPNHILRARDTFDCSKSGNQGSHFIIRMSPTLSVSAVTVEGKPVPYVQAGGITAISSKQDGPFTIAYSGPLQTSGFARVIGPDEATLSGAVWYPMIARHPSTYEISIHAPANWLALAQGEQLSSTAVGGERITAYRMNLPVVWFSATAGPYKRVTTRIDGIDFSTLARDAPEESMRRQNELNSEVVGFYSKTFGAYPFHGWTTLLSDQFVDGVGALEAYSFASYPAGRIPFQDTHEPSHTWWGGIINNDYLASIWNESFADYSQVIYQIDQPIGNREERHRAYISHTGYSPEFDAAPVARSGQDIGPAATALGYVKGAFVLQALEDELGPERFLQTLRTWIRMNPVGHVGAWQDYERIVDRVAGRDMTWFFDEWVRTAGLPDASLVDGAWADGKFTARVAFQGPAYRLTLDAVAVTQNGGVHYFRVAINPAKGGRFALNCPGRPAVVSLDPFQKVLFRHMGRFAGRTIRSFPRDRRFLDSAAPGYLVPLAKGASKEGLPADLDGVLLIGNPKSMPEMAPLCRAAGFVVSGDRLTYDGTTVNLQNEGAMAVVDLPDGKSCMIALGTCPVMPDLGRARLIVFDGKGRMLRALVDPVVDGPLSEKVPAPGSAG